MLQARRQMIFVRLLDRISIKKKLWHTCFFKELLGVIIEKKKSYFL